MTVTSNACLAQRTRSRSTGEALLNVEFEMARQSTSPTNSIRHAVCLDSNLTAKNFLSLALVTAVPLLIVASNMIAVLKEGDWAAAYGGQEI